MLQKNSGFTLIEILIALVIVAIAIGALLVSMTHSTELSEHVTEILAEHWIALNVIASVQTGIKNSPLYGPISGKATMMNRHFSWSAKYIGVDNSNYRQIKVEVHSNSNSHYSLKRYGFIYNDKHAHK